MLYPCGSYIDNASPQAISGRTSYHQVRLAFHSDPQLIRLFCNTNQFGPPSTVKWTSSWPWVDHLASGLHDATQVALFGLAFAAAPLFMSLALLRRSNSPDHSAKGTPSGVTSPCGSVIALRQIVDTRFHVLFHSRLRVLFTFPSRYLFAVGRLRVFSLTPWKA